MYWGPKTTACAKMLIKRTPAVRLLAEKYRRNEFARMYAKKIKLAANNERSAQIRQLKMVFLGHASDYAIVSDYQMGGHNSNSKTKEITVIRDLREEFETVEDLRDALFSYNMYNFPKLFDMFCAGLESGRLRGTSRLQITPIENIITVAHEAHFRCELWFALQTQSYRHDPSISANAARFEKHRNFCALVAKDRRENATNAFNHRRSQIANPNDNNDSSSDDDIGVDNEFF
jgi:hypothetical protein